MKIVLLLNGRMDASASSAAEKAGYALARELHRHGYLSMVLCYKFSPNVDIPHSLIRSYCTYGLKARMISLYKHATKKFPGLRARRVVEGWQDRFYAKVLDSSNADLLYSPKPLFPIAFIAAKKNGTRVVMETSVLHPRFNLETVSRERYRLGLKGASGYTDEKRVRRLEDALSVADRIFAWSNYLRENYIRYGIAADKITVDSNHPGVDLTRFSPAGDRSVDSEFTVLHVSHVSVIKGIPYLLEAWSKLGERIRGKLVIVGRIDKDIRRVMDGYAMDNIVLVGHTTKVEEYYRNADVFVSPSISDAGPLTVLESMACGTPAVVSDHCGFSEVIKDGVNGFTYQYADRQRLEELLLWCFQNREKLSIMRTAAHRTAQKYGLEDYTSSIGKRIDILRNL